jgi:hypothetical protein
MPKSTYQSLSLLRNWTVKSGLLDEKPFAYWQCSLNKVVPLTDHMSTFSHILLALFQETIKMDGAVEKFVAKLEDDDEDVRAEAIKALLALGTQSWFSVYAISFPHLSHLFYQAISRRL